MLDLELKDGDGEPSPYYGMDTWTRRDVLKRDGRELAERYADTWVVCSNKTAEIEELISALIPHAETIVR